MAGQAVDDRQIEIRVVRSVLVNDGATIVDEVQRSVDAADAERRALENHDIDRRRKRPAKRRVRDPRRAQQRPPPVVKIHRQDAAAPQAFEHREHLAIRQPMVSPHVDLIDTETSRAPATTAIARWPAYNAKHDDADDDAARTPAARRKSSALARRLDVRASKTPVCRGRDRHISPCSRARSARSLRSSRSIPHRAARSDPRASPAPQARGARRQARARFAARR